ncbi:CidA/LrgA family protein [Bacillus kexueae]|uniref:CidA/LrgA family protein n=1 Tax=Aeribacillus kexueae TaxID=2078952 RepID=UPI001FAEA31D|nr:CidA/LrgA family protein [Bacillus kexueae]
MNKWIRTILQIILLYGIYQLGKYIQTVFQLMIPGSIIGMLILFGVLHIRGIHSEWLKDGSELLLKYLPILFIPATVGVMNYFSLFSLEGILTVFIVIVSTILVILTSGWMNQWMVGKEKAAKTVYKREHSL